MGCSPSVDEDMISIEERSVGVSTLACNDMMFWGDLVLLREVLLAGWRGIAKAARRFL